MISQLKTADPVLMGAGKRTLNMPKQFTLYECVRNSCAVYSNKRLILSTAVIMYCLCNKFLSCPALSLNQHCTFCLCNRRKDCHNLFHPPVFGYNIAELIYVFKPFFQFLYLGNIPEYFNNPYQTSRFVKKQISIYVNRHTASFPVLDKALIILKTFSLFKDA